MDAIIDFLIQLLTPIGISEPVFQFMLVNAILGLSIYLTLYTGMFSLANAGFMAIGAYVSVVLTQFYDLRAIWTVPFAHDPALGLSLTLSYDFDVPLGLGLLGGATVAAVIAVIIGLPVLRLRDIYLAIATIGFGEIVRILLLNYDDIVASVMTAIEGERVRFRFIQGARGIKNIPQLTETTHLILFIAVVGFLLVRLHRSRFGRAMAAIRQDEKAAANMGINVTYVKTMVFVLSAILAAAAGGFSAHLTRIITPGAYGFDRAVDILAYAVLGGTSTWVGPIVGGMALTALPEVLRFLKEYRGVFNGLVLLGVIVYLPGGLVDPAAWRRTWGRFRARLRGTAAVSQQGGT